MATRTAAQHRWRWVLVGLLAPLTIGLLVEAGRQWTGTASAQSVQSGGDGKSIFVVAGQISPQTYGLYLVDYEHKTVCVYEYLDNTRTLRLMAARTYAFDVQLDAYNTEPEPREIRRLVGQQKRLDDNESP
jgi:hypothetical protein